MEDIQFIDMDDYKSVVTSDLQVIGTENKEAFMKDVLNNKELRSKFKLMCTHSGTFHCDEVMASALLLRTEEFKNSIIVRTREQDIIEQLDIKYDVGGDFDLGKNMFDHHQRPFNKFFWEEYNENQKSNLAKAFEEAKDAGKGEETVDQEDFKENANITKMSSAGLIYKYYGREVIKNICKTEYKKDLSNDDLDRVFEKIYFKVMQEIDARDNGVNQGKDVLYGIESQISHRIGKFNTPWTAPDSMGYSQHTQFKKAMKVCEEYFMHCLHQEIFETLPARSIVLQAWNSRKEFHPSGEMMILKTWAPWKSHIYNIEMEQKLKGVLKFVFYQDDRKMHRIQAVSVTQESFSNRVSVHKDYRGLRDDDLNKAAGITDGGFIHAAGFVGGAWSLESCVKMAEASLAQFEVEKIEKQNEEKKTN